MSWLAPVDTPSSATNNTSPLTSASDPSNQVSNPPSNKSIGKPKRVHQIISLKPEHYEDYKKCHAEVWPEVMEQIKRVGIEDCESCSFCLSLRLRGGGMSQGREVWESNAGGLGPGTGG